MVRPEKPKPLPPKSAEPDKNEWEEIDEGNQKIHGNSLYLPSYDRQVYQLCLLGATDVEIAEFFCVTEQTINNWKKWYSNFFESIRAGKIEADAKVDCRRSFAVSIRKTGKYEIEQKMVQDGCGLKAVFIVGYRGVLFSSVP